MSPAPSPELTPNAAWPPPSLKASQSANVGVHINEFTPGMSEQYKAVGMPTQAFARFFEAADSVGETLV